MTVARINLIPLPTRRSLEIRGIAKRWAALLSLILVVCLSIAAIADRRLQKQRARVELMAKKCQPTEQLMQRVNQLSNQKSRLNEIETTLAQLMPSDDLLQTLGAIAKATNSDPTSSTKIWRAHITVQNAQIPTSDVAEPLPPTTAANVNLTVWGDDDRQIHACLEKLRNNPRFREVRIRTTSRDSSTARKQVEVDAFLYVTKEVPK